MQLLNVLSILLTKVIGSTGYTKCTIVQSSILNT
jgi:hypothetical protein